MEITIKNTTNEKKKAVVFGIKHKDNIWYPNAEKEDFFDFTTDNGVEISIDGVSDRDGLSKILTDSFNSVVFIKSLDVYSNKYHPVVIKTLEMDANGKLEIETIIAYNKLEPKDENYFPVTLDNIGGFHYAGSLLFSLSPNEVIKLVAEIDLERRSRYTNHIEDNISKK